MNELTTTNTQALTLIDGAGSLRNHPAAVYLAGLKSERSRLTQRQALGVVADLLHPGAFAAPERPAHPGRKATAEQRAEYDQARAEYKQLRQAYDWRCLLVNWGALRFQDTQAVRAQLTGKYAPKTANRLLTALRGVLEAAWNLELIPGEDYYRARNVKVITGKTLPAGRALGEGEIKALIKSCEDDPTNAGARDVAIIACMAFAGLRREEVVKLDIGDFDPETGALTVRHGKRDKARITYLENGAGQALGDWITIRGSEPGALFYPINKAGRIVTERLDSETGELQPARMTHQAVYNLLAKRGEQAGVKRFGPHDLRRTYISELLDRTPDIKFVADLAGHDSVVTTSKYDRRPEAGKKKVAGLLHMPYHGRA